MIWLKKPTKKKRCFSATFYDFSSMNTDTDISKFMSRFLRHHPPVRPVHGGWIPITELVKISTQSYTRDDIVRVAKTSIAREKRFELGIGIDDKVEYVRATFMISYNKFDKTFEKKEIRQM